MVSYKNCDNLYSFTNSFKIWGIPGRKIPENSGAHGSAEPKPIIGVWGFALGGPGESPWSGSKAA